MAAAGTLDLSVFEHDRYPLKDISKALEADYGILLDGEIALELDDGETVGLKAGDIVVQNGTRHAWRNPGTKPATLIFVLIGAPRSNEFRRVGTTVNL